MPVERAELRVADSGALEWLAGLEPQELPDEWVLRQLVDADLEDDETVIALLKNYGMLPWPYFDRFSVPDARRHLLAPMRPGRVTKSWWLSGEGTLEDARWWLKTARALAGTWCEVIDGDPVSAWEAEGLPTAPGWEYWPRFANALNVGLEPFHARAEYTGPLVDGGGTIELGQPRVDLYSAACRQVYNLVAEEPTKRRCENEKCGRVFVHQVGGLDRKRHRSEGLRYCSYRCAHAVAQRTYRRRNKAARAT